MFSFTLNCEFPEDGGDSLCPLYEFLRHRTRAQSSWLKSIRIVTPAPYYVHPWWRRAFTRLPAGQFLALQSITLCAKFGSFMKSFHDTDAPIQGPIPVVCWSLEHHLAKLDWLVAKRQLRVKQIKLALKSVQGQWGHFRPLSENLLTLAERRSGYDPDKFLEGHEYLEITKYLQVLEDGCEDTLQRAENTQAGWKELIERNQKNPGDASGNTRTEIGNYDKTSLFRIFEQTEIGKDERLSILRILRQGEKEHLAKADSYDIRSGRWETESDPPVYQGFIAMHPVYLAMASSPALDRAGNFINLLKDLLEPSGYTPPYPF